MDRTGETVFPAGEDTRYHGFFQDLGIGFQINLDLFFHVGDMDFLRFVAHHFYGEHGVHGNPFQQELAIGIGRGNQLELAIQDNDTREGLACLVINGSLNLAGILRP